MILKILYVLSMAVSLTLKFNGQQISYDIQMLFGMIWILIGAVGAMAVQVIHGHSVRIPRILIELLIPWILIFAFTLILWTFWPPELVNEQYFSRMIGNGMLIIVAILNAFVGTMLFGSKVINLSFYSLVITIVANMIVVLPQYSLATFLTYLIQVVPGNYIWQSPLWSLADKLETQGPTMTMGIYAIYFIWFDHIDGSIKRHLLIGISLVCLYIGFKRTAVVGVILVLIFMWLIDNHNVNFRSAVNMIGTVMIVFFGVYIYLLDSGNLERLASFFKIDMMGRATIYSYLVQLFSFNPLYIGKGFTYVAKTMYDSIGFESHSEIVRMYSEIGFVPFFVWLYYYLIFFPKSISSKYGNQAGRMFLVTVIYVFGTFLTENTLMTYSMQYSLALFSLAYIYKPLVKQSVTIVKDFADETGL